MRTITIPYKARGLQAEFHNNRKRYNLLLCHRRFGKTVMVINELIRGAVTCKLSRPRFAYIAPTYVMAKEIVWDYLKHYAQCIPGIKFNESELRADFPNGARIKLLGGDKVDALRGLYLDGVALDEYAQMKPSLFTEVISPALSDRGGYCIFIGTPKGKNHFHDLYELAIKRDDWYVKVHKASDTRYVKATELDLQRQLLSADEYMQEFECSWDAAIKGAFYAEELSLTREQNRICHVPYDKNLKVNTYWDIGFKDDTAIVFTQTFGKEIRIIDFYASSGMTLPDYARVLGEKGYNYGDHYFPHDAKIKPMSFGKSLLEVAQAHGIVAETGPMLSIKEGIDQGRMLFKNCWFDLEKTADLIEALGSYRRDWKDDKQTFTQKPVHDWSSHAADAFRYMAISTITEQPETIEEYNEAYGSYVKQETTYSNF